MAKDSIFIDTKQIDKLTLELKGFESEVGESVYQSLNRTLDQVVTHVGRIVPKEYSIKSSEVKQSFRNGIKKPTKSKLEASLTARGHTLSLAHFPHSPKAPSKRIYKVRTTIKKTGGRKTINTAPSAFVASTGAKTSNKIQFNVFKRIGKESLPIVVLRTLSIPQMITNDNITTKIQDFANQKLAERLEHEIIYRMTSIGKKIKR